MICKFFRVVAAGSQYRMNWTYVVQVQCTVYVYTQICVCTLNMKSHSPYRRIQLKLDGIYDDKKSEYISFFIFLVLISAIARGKSGSILCSSFSIKISVKPYPTFITYRNVFLVGFVWNVSQETNHEVKHILDNKLLWKILFCSGIYFLKVATEHRSLSPSVPKI